MIFHGKGDPKENEKGHTGRKLPYRSVGMIIRTFRQSTRNLFTTVSQLFSCKTQFVRLNYCFRL